MPKIQEVNTGAAQKPDHALGTVANGAWAVVADMYTQSFNRGFNQPFGKNSLFGDIDDDQNMTGKKAQCFGACSEYSKKSELDGLLNVSEKTGGDVKAVALEAAENALSYEFEYLLKKTLFKVNYQKENNRGFVNKGRDLVDLVPEDRRDRYEELKDGLVEARTGFVISEEDVKEGRHYIDVFQNREGQVEEFVIQFDGSLEELHRLNENLVRLTGEEELVDDADFSKPIFADREISLDEVVHAIENSYESEESRQNARDYLDRLHRDTSDLSHLDEYQARALELASQIEQELLSKSNLREGLASLVWALEGVANGEEFTISERVEHPLYSDSSYLEYVINKRNEEAAGNVPDNHLISLGQDVADKNQIKQKDNETELHTQDSEVVSIFLRLVNGGRYQEDVMRLSREQVLISNNQADILPVWRTFASTTLHISEQSTLRLEDHIAGVYKIMGDQKRIFDFVSKTGIATAGALASLHIIEHVGAIPAGNAEDNNSDTKEINPKDIPSKSLPIQNEPVFESMATVLEKSIYTKSEKRLIFSLFLKDSLGKEGKDISHKGEGAELILPAKIIELMNNHGQDVAAFKKIIDFVRIINALSVEKQATAIQNEEARIITVFQLLWETVQGLIKPVNKSVDTYEPNKPVEQVSFVIGVWMMLNILNYYRALESLSRFVTKPYGKKNLREALAEEQPEELIQKEPAPWLIFAIILLLAKIREQGFQTKQAAPKKKKKTSSGKSVIIVKRPPSGCWGGLIFAFSS